MELRPVDARVLACLIEKETTVPDSYPLTLNALRSACNQSTNRNPVTTYDDRTIEDALVSLKAMGLVRFVHPSHGGRTLRYRHVADERWELGRGALGVVALLILRGPETPATLRARAERFLDEDGVSIEQVLDELMGRQPDALVERLEPQPGEREARYAQLVAAQPEVRSDPPHDAEDSARRDSPRVERIEPTPVEPAAIDPAPDEQADLLDAALDELADLRRRVERLERLYDG